MIIAVIEGSHGVAGRSQGFRGLPFRRSEVNCSVNGPNTPCVETAWTPTPEELEALNRGGSVYVRTLGEAIQPMMVWAGPTPRDPSVEGREDWKDDVRKAP